MAESLPVKVEQRQRTGRLYGAIALAVSLIVSTAPIASATALKGMGTWSFENAAKANCQWYYGWEPWPADGKNPSAGTPGALDNDENREYAFAHSRIEWVPAIAVEDQLTPDAIAHLKAGREKGIYKYLIGFNEPGKGLPPDKAIALWPQLESTGLKLVAPSYVDEKDFNEFMTKARAKGCRVDCLNFHIYWDITDPDAVRTAKERMIRMHNKWGLPIWITEMGPVDFRGAEQWWGKPKGLLAPTEANAIAEMQAMNDMYNSLGFVQRISYYNGKDVYAPGRIFDDQWVLTPFGRAFRDYHYVKNRTYTFQRAVSTSASVKP